MLSSRAERRPKRIRLSTWRYSEIKLDELPVMTSVRLTYVGLPLVSLDAPWLGVPEGVDTTVEVNLASGLLVAGD